MGVMTLLNPCSIPLIGARILCRIPTRLFKWIGPILGGWEFAMGMHIVVATSHYIAYAQISGLVLLWGRCAEFIQASPGLTRNARMRGYRELQVREKIYNSTFRGRILPASVAGVPSEQVLCGVAFLTFFRTGNWLLSSLFLMLYVGAALFGLVLLTSASCIFVRSEGWIEAGKLGGGAKNSYFRRVHQSFRPLRLEFGSNFVDKLTPLVVQDFSSRQTATLVLLLAGNKFH